jgi:prefoldin subunit 5
MLMNMENENVKPSYEELSAAYQQLVAQAQELDRRYQALLQDKMLEKIKVISNIFENKEAYPEKVLTLAEWHLKQMLAKPKDQK